MNIKGKTILITGGGSGIGLESARQFLAEGLKVIITGRNEAKLAAAKKMLPSLIAIKSDVENQEDALALFNQVAALGVLIFYTTMLVLEARRLTLGLQMHKF